MRDWISDTDRSAGTKYFWEEIMKPKNKSKRDACVKDPKQARKIFAEIAQFYLEEDLKAPIAPSGETAIPKDVEFRIFEAKDLDSRGKLVTLVLRDPPATPKSKAKTSKAKKETVDPDGVWMCTYIVYPP